MSSRTVLLNTKKKFFELIKKIDQNLQWLLYTIHVSRIVHISDAKEETRFAFSFLKLG